MHVCACVCVRVCVCMRACVFDSFVFILRIWPITMNSDFEDSIPILSHGTPSLGTLKIIIYPFHVTHHLEVRCHCTKYGWKSLALWKTLSKQGPGTGTGKSNLLPPYPPNFITGVCVGAWLETIKEQHSREEGTVEQKIQVSRYEEGRDKLYTPFPEQQT